MHRDRVRCVGRWQALGTRLVAGWAGLFVLGATPGLATSYRIIYKFGPLPDSNSPSAGLVADSAGRLYGPAGGGGSKNWGTVYRLTRPASGQGAWSEEILHSFDYAQPEGAEPISSVLLDSQGNVYGVTASGGPLSRGSIFELSNLTGWPLTILHAFGPPPDGQSAQVGAPVFGPGGLIYGVTALGGYQNRGMAYSVSPLGDTTEYAILHVFGKGADGYVPFGLALAPAGRLSGVTEFGATNRAGIAFSLRTDAAGAWHEDVNYEFGNSPGVVSPQAPDILGKNILKHDLYGCGSGGKHNAGVAYKLSPPAGGGSGAWTETVLYNFGATSTDANTAGPCGLTQDPSGRLYGTSAGGGAYGYGTFFELDPPAQGATAWTETILFNFDFNSPSGGFPQYGAPLRVGGLFYGTVETQDGLGAIFELSPNAQPGTNPIARPVQPSASRNQ